MSDPVMMWLVVGAGLIIFEVATAPGLGLFLAGLGALTTAVVIEGGMIDPAHTPAQYAWFFAFTTLWTVGLWKPMKKFRNSRTNKEGNQPKVQDIVGSIAVVGAKGLKRGETGQAHWSGTIMSARLDHHSTVEFIPEGTQVLIDSVSGTILNVTPIIRS